MKKLINQFIVATHILVSTTLSSSYAFAQSSEVVIDHESEKALGDLKAYCEDVGVHPLNYSQNSKDKVIVSVPIEISPGKIKYDTLIKLDHAKGPDYLSCFSQFKTPFQDKSLPELIAVNDVKDKATCKPVKVKNSPEIAALASGVNKVSEKLACEESKKTTIGDCSNQLTYCGMENLHLTKILKMPTPTNIKCNSMLEGAGDVGECMATFIRGAFDEITDTLKMLVVDGPKWIYGKTIGRFFQEPAVKQMENIGSMEAIATSSATDKDIKEEAREPEKSLVKKITDFTHHLILEKGSENYGCKKWSTGVPGIGSCVEPAGSWECASCKEKAMTVCGVAGYATGMIVETAVLAAPVGVIAGTALGALSKTSKVVKTAEAAKATNMGMKAAKSVASTGVKVAKAGLKVLAPIAKAGYKIGKGVLSALKLIPGVELTAKILSKPFKLWMKADDVLTSKVWNLTYHGSKAYTETLIKTGNVALASKSAAVAVKLNQTQKAGEALLKTQSALAAAESGKKEELTLQLAAEQKRYESLSKNISAEELDEVRFLESEHASEIAAKYKKDQIEIEKAEVVAEDSVAAVEGPSLTLTTKKEKAEELAKILAVDEETQKLISNPVIAQYLYLNHFASNAEKNELRVALQDIVNSTEVGNTDIFALVNQKLEQKLKDPAIQAKVKETFKESESGLRPSKMRSSLYGVTSRTQQLAAMPTTISRLKKLTDDGFSLEVLDEGLFHFYGATQLGLRESQMRPWELVLFGFSAIRPNQVENISPELWASMAHFASETEAPIHGYSTNSGDALRGLIPSMSRFMGKNEEEYLAFEAKSAKALEEGKGNEVGPFCTNVWCGEEKRHENAVQRFGEQVTGQAKTEPKTYEADKRGDYLDPNYALKHLAGRNSSEWNANSIYIYLRAHSKDAANKWVDNVRADETKHMAIFASGYKYFFGNQTGKRTKEMLEKIMDLKKQASVSNSSGDVLSESLPTLMEIGVTHLFVEKKVRDFTRSVPLKTMEKIFDTPVKTLTDLETVPLSAEKQKAILEMNEKERAKREMLARWTPAEREKYLALKAVEKEKGDLIESLVENLFDGFRGAEVPSSKEALAIQDKIKKLRTGLDAKTNALIQLSLNETLRDYQIMNNKFVRSHPELKVRFKNAQEGFVVEKKSPGEAGVLKTQRITDSTFLLRVEKPKDLELTPGAAVRVELKTGSGKDFRVLSLASSPDKDHLEFAVGISDSEFKQALMKLKPGQTVTLNKAKGAMNFDPTKPTVMIAGGIGITPFRSMIQYVKDNKLQTPMHLYYSNKSQIPFGEEFVKAAQESPQLSVTTVLSKPDEYWKGLKGRIDEPFLANEIPKLPKDSKYYIVGPPAMVTGTQESLVKMGVKPEDIQVELYALKPDTQAGSPAAVNGGMSSAAAPEKAVCRCFSVGESQIIRVIKKGATSIEEIAEATGATRGCGGCTCDVEKILKCEISH